MKQMFKLILTTLVFVISVVVLLATEKNNVAEKFVSPLNIGDEFVPAGYMGCGRVPENKSIDINPAFTVNPHSGSTCYKIEYVQNCPEGWAGVYWTNEADDDGANWGQYTGMDLSKKGYTKVTFWARGEKGNEAVEFGSGGVKDAKYQHKDSYKANIEGKTVILTTKWQQYTIDLTGKDLSSVIGGFFWSANWRANPTGLIFYLDDIQFE